jgi:hypothetical protein
MNLDEMKEFIRNPEGKFPKFVENSSEEVEVMLNLIINTNILSFIYILDYLYIEFNNKDDYIKLADFLNVYYNQLIPEVVCRYKEEYEARKSQKGNAPCIDASK